MPNPPVLVCDADSLFQLFIADELRPLRDLKRTYGVQPVIVNEVEIELSSTRKFRNRFDPQLSRAISYGTIEVLDTTSLQAHLSGSPPLATAGIWSSIQSLGAQYRRHVGSGEAYTHAAAVVLVAPALSNDMNALRVLEQLGFAIPSPVLRSFDLVAFGYQAGILTGPDCEKVRQALLREGEVIERPFRHASFMDGLKQFSPRLLDGSKVLVGNPSRPGPAHTQRLLVSPFTTP